MANTYLSVDLTTGHFKQVEASTTSAGAGDAGKIPALGSDGKLDVSLIPANAGGGNVQNMPNTEALNAGDWINVFNNSGTASVRRALAADTTKPCHGFVIT